MDLEFGNAGRLETNGTGWFVGFSEWAKAGVEGKSDLRFMPKEALAKTLHAKWKAHAQGDPDGQKPKPRSEGRTISMLVSETGRFRAEFSCDDAFDEGRTETCELTSHGDFVIWGEGLCHRWFVDSPCTILTIRWIPLAESANSSD